MNNLRGLTDDSEESTSNANRTKSSAVNTQKSRTGELEAVQTNQSQPAAISKEEDEYSNDPEFKSESAPAKSKASTPRDAPAPEQDNSTPAPEQHESEVLVA